MRKPLKFLLLLAWVPAKVVLSTGGGHNVFVAASTGPSTNDVSAVMMTRLSSDQPPIGACHEAKTKASFMVLTKRALTVVDRFGMIGGSHRHLEKCSANMPLPTMYSATSLALSVSAGGAALQRKTRQPAKKNPLSSSQQSNNPRPKRIAWTASALAAATVLYATRETWAPLLLNKEALQQTVLIQLHKLHDLPKISSYVTYILGMALWETAGLSTIPVETAAGMVFHWDGFLLSATGKLLGACLAFALGRNLLHATIQQQFAGNSFLQTIQSTAKQQPFLTSLLIKCGPLPETIKNFGSSLLTSIRWWMFTTATILHGWTFSALWTYLGVDTAMRLEVPELPTDRRLQFLLIAALLNGIIVSPFSMVYLYRLSGKGDDKEKKTKRKSRGSK